MTEQPPGRAEPDPSDPWSVQLSALGGFIRAQRQLAKLSLREMSSLTTVSNAYLSQVERGLHQPSLRVLRSIADALNLSTEQMLTEAGWAAPDGPEHPAPDGVSADGFDPGPNGGTEAAINADPRLSPAQREALLGVYRSFVEDAD